MVFDDSRALAMAPVDAVLSFSADALILYIRLVRISLRARLRTWASSPCTKPGTNTTEYRSTYTHTGTCSLAQLLHGTNLLLAIRRGLKTARGTACMYYTKFRNQAVALL